LVLLPLALAGCTAGHAASSSPGATSPAATSGPEVQVVAVGDSITEADSADFDGGDIGADSWATYADGDGLRIVGGWAHAGATTMDMLAGVTDRTASTGVSMDADVLVLMAGSNDVDWGVPATEVEANLVKIVDIVHAGRVVLSTIPPEDGMESDVRDLNTHLTALASSEGWQLVDPMVSVRDDDGGWLPGMSDDGVHPTAEAAQLIATSLRPALIGSVHNDGQQG
jgi:lysophospholipase L1-like esterase